MIAHISFKRPVLQKGAVLIISLIILMVITLLGVTAMQTTTLDTKMAGNYRSYKISFEGAEAALSEAQTRLAIPLGLDTFSRPTVKDNTEPNPKIWNLNPPKPDSNCNLAQDYGSWWFQWDSNCWENYAIGFSDAIYGLETTSGQTTTRPLYLIEFQISKPDHLGSPGYPGEDRVAYKDYYRITARGSTGQNSQTEVMLQSVFAWRYLKHD